MCVSTNAATQSSPDGHYALGEGKSRPNLHLTGVLAQRAGAAQGVDDAVAAGRLGQAVLRTEHAAGVAGGDATNVAAREEAVGAAIACGRHCVIYVQLCALEKDRRRARRGGRADRLAIDVSEARRRDAR